MGIDVYGCNAPFNIIIALGLVILLDCVEVLLQISLVMQGHDHCHVVASRHLLRDEFEGIDRALRGVGVADLLTTQQQELVGSLVCSLLNLHYYIK
jgi:hypothetical protein